MMLEVMCVIIIAYLLMAIFALVDIVKKMFKILGG
jgi:hypothetical protein